MRIVNIKLKNFSCFIDEEFDFQAGLNIISAKNGGGKSQLFNAFYWTLFNEIYDREDGFIRASELKLAPDYYLSDYAPEDFNTEVIVKLVSFNVNDSDSDNEIEYTFKREIKFRRDISGLKVLIPSHLEISTVQFGETDFIRDSLHRYTLDSLFPPSIRKFMWYVGETMKDLIDFKTSETLNNALNQISYFPKYKEISKICKKSVGDIDSKIEKEFLKHQKISQDENATLTGINSENYKIQDLEKKIIQKKNEKIEIEIDKANIANKLKGFNQFIEYQEKLIRIEGDIERTKENIERLEGETKEKLIGTWMLNGCSKLISESKNNLSKLEIELQKIEKDNNPIPTNLPGSDYVQRMIDDCKCYICERDVEIDTPPYLALKKRVFDIEKNAQERLLQDNYTELMRFKNRLTRLIPSITQDITDSFEKQTQLIKKRNNLYNRKRNLFDELGISDEQKSHIEQGALNANNLLKDYDLREKLLDRVNREIQKYEVDLISSENELARLKQKRDAFITKANVSFIEEEAAKYIRIINEITEKLETEAYNQMILEIEEESNRLYNTYMSRNAPGKIRISNQVEIVDFKTEEQLYNLSTAQETGGKLSVINSILSLSEKKKNERYPLIMDAPTSDYDPENTLSITRNISSSFGQIIIMSKDYHLLDRNEIDELIDEAKIVKFYQVASVKIEEDLGTTRTNKHSVKEVIK